MEVIWNKKAQTQVLSNFREPRGIKSLFNKTAESQLASLLEKRSLHWRFSKNFAKFLRTLILRNTSGRMLL